MVHLLRLQGTRKFIKPLPIGLLPVRVGPKVLTKSFVMKNFIAHGYYTWSNCCGYEVQLSDCGDAARLRYPKGDDFVITDWLEIEYIDKYCQKPSST